MGHPTSFPERLPFVGRSEDLAHLRSLLKRALKGKGGALFLTGEAGVGKSRLALLLAEEARGQGWTVATGRAYPAEAGVPYALFSDAMMSTLKELGRESLAVLTRGSETELEVLFPLLRAGRPTPEVPSRTPDSDLHLYWIFAQFLKALAARQPLLIVLDDLHWADASSVELLRFIARHLVDCSILVVATVNEAERATHPILPGVEQSLQGLGIAGGHQLRPLSHVDTAELIRQAFGTGETVTREFTALIHGWTRGNPFFLEETLKALVDAGRLRWESGQWLGWEMDDLELPGSIRDAVLFRLSHLSSSARDVAEVVAIIGARARYGTLKSVCSLDEPQLVEALEELGQRNLLSETGSQEGPLYEFQHPMVRKIVVGEIGLARQRLVHGKIATALEVSYGTRTLDHAEELALHFTHGDTEGGTDKAVPYLAAAGRSALERFAAQEAADHLSAALDRLKRGGPQDESGADGPSVERFSLMENLARARQRLGEFETAIELWGEARDDAHRRGDAVGVASMERRVGLAHFYAGRHSEALAALESAVTSAGGNLHLLGRIRMAIGVCFNMLGRGSEAHEQRT